MSDVAEVAVGPTRVAGVRLHRLPLRRDARGSLVAAEIDAEVPFVPRRSFLVFDVPGDQVRGEHAHRHCHQFMSCVRGACSVRIDDGEVSETLRLDDPTLGLYIPPLVWAAQHEHTPDAVLWVLASHGYDPDDYIRDYDEFLAARAGRAP